MFVVWKGWITNALTEEIVGFDSSYEFQLPVNELPLLTIQVGETLFGLR